MDAIRAEKEAAIRRYRRLKRIGTFLRCVEAAAAVFFLSWSSARLPSPDFLRRLAAILLSPRFVFLLGNAIVLLLFAKSGQPPSSSSSASSAPASSSSTTAATGDIYEKFLGSKGGRVFGSPLPSPPKEKVVYEDKEVCVEMRVCRRSRSARMERQPVVGSQLRRAGTHVVGRKGKRFPPTAKETKGYGPLVEEADAEEFRRVVEAFIAKQTKFHREDCIATSTPPFASAKSIQVTEQSVIEKWREALKE